MTEPEDLDEDLFADLYEGDESFHQPDPAAQPPAPLHDASQAQPDQTNTFSEAQSMQAQNGSYNNFQDEPQVYGENIYGDDNAVEAVESANNQASANDGGFTGTVGIKEDGKMFIGGLNWETTDQSLRNYFSQFGEVMECTVMRDGATGRSRGFGFLTFKDPKTVNTVMVKEHFLDNKIIDPKRAIPRDEQEKTSKIFVGGVSQEATERDFEQFFAQFGRVIDATLMMDKDTGRPRGFGFVTFEGEAAVEATLAQPLEILGKPIEVKRAQPRGNVRDEDEGTRGGKFGRKGHGGRGQDNTQGGGPASGDGQQGQTQQEGQGNDQMSPQMMAQYWQRMQQYFNMMQQQMAANMQGGQPQNMQGNMGNMNPQMMQQMMAMQGMNRGQNGSPQNAGGMGGGNMDPQMMQQMQQGQGGYPRMMSPMGGAPGGTPPGSAAALANRPGYNAQEQLAFEQRKYEQQQARRMGFNQGGGQPSSWEGMYEDVPQPNMGPGGGGRGGRRGRGGGGGGNGGGQENVPQGPQSQAPANAPTGPKNAGKPGANYRGGGRGGHRGYHPYARNG